MSNCETARLLYINANHVDEDIGDKIRVDSDWFDVVGVDVEAMKYLVRPSVPSTPMKEEEKPGKGTGTGSGSGVMQDESL